MPTPPAPELRPFYVRFGVAAAAADRLPRIRGNSDAALIAIHVVPIHMIFICGKCWSAVLGPQRRLAQRVSHVLRRPLRVTGCGFNSGRRFIATFTSCFVALPTIGLYLT
eukprot:COSAG02_NODE_5530_length_4244_cov_4.808331_1_plen_110_part_00